MTAVRILKHEGERTWVTKDMVKALVVDVAFTGRKLFMMNFLVWGEGGNKGEGNQDYHYSHRLQFFHHGWNQILFDWHDNIPRMEHSNESAEKVSPGKAIRFIEDHWDQRGSPELWTISL